MRRGTSVTDWGDLLDRPIAGACSLLVIVLATLVLLSQRSPLRTGDAGEPALRLRFIARAHSPDDAGSPPAAASALSRGNAAAGAPAPPAMPLGRVGAPASAPRVLLYGRDGRPRVPDDLGNALAVAARPPGSLPDGREAGARGPFDRVNPVDYQATRFDQAWRGKGTAGDVALENAHGSVTGAAVTIPLGDGDQPARARPPPSVRFNPALHERVADLGSEATGDAYKAAPIADEPAPGLDGAASRIVREQLAALERDFPHCGALPTAALMRPVRLHLAQLERIEHAFAHGADPVRAEHLLPREADAAYMLARRALWYARQKLAQCSR